MKEVFIKSLKAIIERQKKARELYKNGVDLSNYESDIETCLIRIMNEICFSEDVDSSIIEDFVYNHKDNPEISFYHKDEKSIKHFDSKTKITCKHYAYKDGFRWEARITKIETFVNYILQGAEYE